MMKELQMGTMIASKRKEKGITQDQLAAYMGVSKTAVSKWETNQSYPDVTFLPILASYFNISVDMLIGYEPQMSAEDIALYYKKMCTAFVERSFDEVMEELAQQAKKYHSCYKLLLYIALLYINHLNLAKPEQVEGIVKQTKELLILVRTHSDRLREQRLALECEAMCDIMSNQPHQAIALLERIEPITSNFLLAQSYRLSQQNKEAIEVLQTDILQACSVICNASQMLIQLYTEDPAKLEELIQRIEAFNRIFKVSKVAVGTYLPIYINAFTAYAMIQNKEKTYFYLHRYTELLEETNHFQFQYDDFFDHIQPDTLELDIPMVLPRDEAIIKKSCLQCITENPALFWLAEEQEFQQIVLNITMMIAK